MASFVNLRLIECAGPAPFLIGNIKLQADIICRQRLFTGILHTSLVPFVAIIRNF